MPLYIVRVNVPRILVVCRVSNIQGEEKIRSHFYSGQQKGQKGRPTNTRKHNTYSGTDYEDVCRRNLAQDRNY